MAAIEVTSETAALGNVLGLTRPGGDGVLELTPKGEAWLDEWLKRMLDELTTKETK